MHVLRVALDVPVWIHLRHLPVQGRRCLPQDVGQTCVRRRQDLGTVVVRVEADEPGPLHHAREPIHALEGLQRPQRYGHCPPLARRAHPRAPRVHADQPGARVLDVLLGDLCPQVGVRSTAQLQDDQERGLVHGAAEGQHVHHVPEPPQAPLGVPGYQGLGDARVVVEHAHARPRHAAAPGAPRQLPDGAVCDGVFSESEVLRSGPHVVATGGSTLQQPRRPI
mmetsp:Transcript_108418/g.306583  ORF Transcript_108418/g.306583 Transcript_108418/m.306583 type:complete len:223 (-) Transcript_108418:569-1237(-)